MQINGYGIVKEAFAFANQCLMENIEENGHLSERDIKFIHSPEFFSSQPGRAFLGNLILGALDSYHNGLREKLLEESNIDIGELTI